MTTNATLVERFGDHALDVDYMGAVFIEETVASALLEIGIGPKPTGLPNAASPRDRGPAAAVTR